MADPTKDTEEKDPVPTGDMNAALEAIRASETSKDKTDEPEPEKDEEKDEEEEDKDELDLSDKKDDEDIDAWKERKEKGVQKIVERTKAKEQKLDADLAEIETIKTNAKVYLDNKKDIDGVLMWMKKALDPVTHDEAVEELRAMVHKDYVPEVDSEKQLKSVLEKRMASEIEALRAEIASLREPLQKDAQDKATREAVKQKAEDTFDEVALKIEGTCNGYVLEKEHYIKALEAYPSLDGADAAKLYLHSAIQKHTAGLASKPKKKEIIDDATKKDAERPKSGDMLETLAYLRATGVTS